MVPSSISPALRVSGRRIGVIVAVGLCALGLSTMPASAARTTTYRVTISAPAQSPLVNVTFAITGSVSPAADGATVHLQQYIDGGFKIVASTQLDADSNYRFTQKMANVGGYVYRVVKPAGGGILEGISPLRRVWVTGATMRSGPIMKGGNSLVSSDGTYLFRMLTTGDLVITIAATGHVLWSMGTDGHPGAWATLRNDGDLVVHASDGSFLKDTGSGGHPIGSYTITMEDDANLVIRGPHGVPLWSSQTARDTLQVNEALQPGQFLTSANDGYQVVMETGGDLVVLDTKTATTIWDSYTDTANSEVTMQDDGNLDLKGPEAKPLWSSRTPGHPGATATIEDDGDFVVSLKGVTLWASMGINGVLGDDYPNVLRNSDKDSLIDPWRFYNRECVSFVAWRINHANGVAFTNYMDGGHWGNANNWDDNARALGYTVNNTPARGAIAQSDTQSSAGHVAWVAAVGKGTVTVEDYNYSSPGNYGVRTVPTSMYLYIHIKDL